MNQKIWAFGITANRFAGIFLIGLHGSAKKQCLSFSLSPLRLPFFYGQRHAPSVIIYYSGFGDNVVLWIVFGAISVDTLKHTG